MSIILILNDLQMHTDFIGQEDYTCLERNPGFFNLLNELGGARNAVNPYPAVPPRHMDEGHGIVGHFIGDVRIKSLHDSINILTAAGEEIPPRLCPIAFEVVAHHPG